MSSVKLEEKTGASLDVVVCVLDCKFCVVLHLLQGFLALFHNFPVNQTFMINNINGANAKYNSRS